jgi:hypothetical protein
MSDGDATEKEKGGVTWLFSCELRKKFYHITSDKLERASLNVD